MATCKLCTEELEDPTVDATIQTETTVQTQYTSIDSIKEDEESGPSSFSVSKTIFIVLINF